MQLAKLAPAAEIPIAIERPTGLLVDSLLESGHPVVPIHPNVVKAGRPRCRAVGAKSDFGDSYLIADADVLRTDGHGSDTPREVESTSAQLGRSRRAASGGDNVRLR